MTAQTDGFAIANVGTDPKQLRSLSIRSSNSCQESQKPPIGLPLMLPLMLIALVKLVITL